MKLVIFCAVPGLYVGGAHHPLMASHPVDAFTEAQLFEIASDPHIALAFGHTVFPIEGTTHRALDAHSFAQLVADRVNGAGNATGPVGDPASAVSPAAEAAIATIGTVRTTGAALGPVPGAGLPDILPVAGDTADAAAERAAQVLAAEMTHSDSIEVATPADVEAYGNAAETTPVPAQGSRAGRRAR